MWPMLIMAGAQMLSKKDKEDRDRKLAADTQRYSPWTGLSAQSVEDADPVGTGMQAYGAYMGGQQAQANQAANAKLIDAQTGYYNRGAAGPFSLATKQ